MAARTEIITDAVIREVFEETGLIFFFFFFFSPMLCGIKDWSNDDGSRYMVLFYKTDKFEGALSSLHLMKEKFAGLNWKK